MQTDRKLSQDQLAQILREHSELRHFLESLLNSEDTIDEFRSRAKEILSRISQREG